MEIKSTQSALDNVSTRAGQRAVNPRTVDFGKVLVDNVNKVNNLQQAAASLQQRYELGDKNVELHDVMIKQQAASLSFQALLQTRNRLVSVYQEISGMQL